MNTWLKIIWVIGVRFRNVSKTILGKFIGSQRVGHDWKCAHAFM